MWSAGQPVVTASAMHTCGGSVTATVPDPDGVVVNGAELAGLPALELWSPVAPPVATAGTQELAANAPLRRVSTTGAMPAAPRINLRRLRSGPWASTCLAA